MECINKKPSCHGFSIYCSATAKRNDHIYCSQVRVLPGEEARHIVRSTYIQMKTVK